MESQAAAAHMDALEFAKRFWAAMNYDDVDATKQGERTRYAEEPVLVVDAKALYDAAQKESITSFQDQITGIEVTALRERMDVTSAQWKWVSSQKTTRGRPHDRSDATLRRSSTARTISAQARPDLHGGQRRDKG